VKSQLERMQLTEHGAQSSNAVNVIIEVDLAVFVTVALDK